MPFALPFFIKAGQASQPVSPARHRKRMYLENLIPRKGGFYETKSFRKFASIALVAAMAISSVSPVYATDVEDQPEITVESEAETDNPAGETEESEPVESEEASESSEESDPEESYPYIILLPTNEDVSYAYEEDHLSAELSTDEYGILLYEEGEDVSLTVDAEEFYIVNAADNSMVIDGNYC